MNVATETFVKEVLSAILSRTRSNGPNYIMTNKYKRQLEREEEACLRNEVNRDSNAMLPVEAASAREKGPLGMEDVRIALEMGDAGIGQMRLMVDKVVNGWREGEFEDDEWVPFGFGDDTIESTGNGIDRVKRDEDVPMMNGIHEPNGFSGEELRLEENDWGWEGGGVADRTTLDGLLAECLTGG
jgi:transcriptional coactivator HFI1/ADA1